MPLAGRDDRCPHYGGMNIFQSTRPLRGATHYTGNDGDTAIFQSTRPMRGATGARQFKTRRYQHFNPRAPCGARRNQRRRHAFTTLFQSTRPMRGATCVQDGTIYDS